MKRKAEQERRHVTVAEPTALVRGTCSCGFAASGRSADALRAHLGSHDTYHAYLITAKVVAS